MTKGMFSSVQRYKKRTVLTEVTSKEIQQCDVADNEGLFH